MQLRLTRISFLNLKRQYPALFGKEMVLNNCCQNGEFLNLGYNDTEWFMQEWAAPLEQDANL